MSITPGTRLGVYEVTALIGQGGMGQVYRATDTKLSRSVALKVLPDSFATDPESLLRFTREALTLASLNHPNIATIHGLEESDGVRALVMELVEGDDLSHRIAQGPIPPDEALPIAKQIAEALEAAHEQGIIHRDLKPANIKVRKDGAVKVLDFGLAKAMDPGSSPRVPPGQVGATITTPALTEAGIILGTAAYMAPEQAKGRPLDRRADIWAFGVVLYEMLTGRRLFAAEDLSETLAAVLTREVSMTALPAAVPARLRALVRDCLIRDPRQRLRDIGDARLTIEKIMAGAPDDAPVPAPALPTASAGPARSALPWVMALLMTAVGALGWWRAMRPADLQPLQRFNIEVSPDLPLSRSSSVALSPDGTRLVVRLQSADGSMRLHTRLLTQKDLTALVGTEGAAAPFFSPDGEWIGFASGGKLKKVSVSGGAPLGLCDAPAASNGASWGDDGNIVFAGTSRDLMRVPSSGGTPEEVMKLPEGPYRPLWPQVLPGSDAVLYHATTGNSLRDDDLVEGFEIKTRRRVVVQRGGFSPRYLKTAWGGSLLFLHRGSLFAAPFDERRLTTTGAAVPVVDGIAANLSGSGEFSVSQTGTLAYLSGSPQQGARTVSWVDRAGHVEPFPVTPGPYFSPRLSPDGRRLLMSMDLDSQTAIVVQDVDRGAPSRLTTTDGVNEYPVWTHDGLYILFHSTRQGAPGLYWARSDGSGEPQRISDAQPGGHPYSISPDGKYLALTMRGVDDKPDLAIATIQGDPAKPILGKPEPFVATPSAEGFPTFSPDGRWLAYQSNESGAAQVYVRPFPGPGSRFQISSNGGGVPVWSRSASELLYRDKSGAVMTVSYTANGASFIPGKPQAWPGARVHGFSTVYGWDLAPDGKRLIGLQDNADDAKPATHLMFLLHFGDELQRRAATSH